MSTLKTNALIGTSTAGSIAVTGEGNSTTTNLQQGLAKAWFFFNYTAVQDSFNISTVTDEATGHCFGNFSSNMNNDDFAHPFKSGAYRDRYEGTGPDAATSRTNTLETYNSSGSSVDDGIINCTVHGDLA
jgi:hypothetical protein